MEKGDIECVIGPNGAGKTTFFNLITGAIKPDSGTVYFDGDDITGQSINEIARRGMVRKYQTPSVYNEMSVRRNIRIAFGEDKPPNADERLTELLDLIGLTERVDETAGKLDHGTKQWLEIGMVLANDPQLILLDEPTAGMTTEETMKTADLITSINDAEGVSIIAIEHDIEFVRQLSSTVTVLHQGSVLAQGSVEDIESNEEVQNVYLGSG
ncbi:ATP-binding cassette domain-containing protein [Haloplanus aerogenes]|nr:ATP-binding cassette domain-containing protein [Haloplanus aerogenes]